MTIHVAGLGPGNPALLTHETSALLASGIPVIVRTRRHPTLDALSAADTFMACDDIYEAAAEFGDAYGAIAARVLTEAAKGDVVYLTPGHPLIAEQATVALLALARDSGIPVHIYSAVSYVDVAATALRIDARDLQLCDGLDLRIDPARPALISQVFDRDAASRIKLTLLDLYPPDHPVTALSRAGEAAEELSTMPLSEVDYRAWSYLDSLYLPPVEATDDLRHIDGLAAIVARLNAPGGCPWDQDQTHESLRQHLLEEAYELLDAIDREDTDAIVEELGDVLLQVLMHSEVGRRQDTFAPGDVPAAIGAKLIRRHPHVFGDAVAETAADVAPMWDALKKAEKPDGSILDGVPVALPALAASQSIQGRARRIGFDWPDIEGPLEKLNEELAEFARADNSSDREDEFGDILFVVANIAQRLDIDAEQALRRANAKFRRRFALVEALARQDGVDLKELGLTGLDDLWDRAKAELAGQ